MTRLGVPEPAGPRVTTRACQTYLDTGSDPAGLAREIDGHLATLESTMGRRLGDPVDPLLVRSVPGGLLDARHDGDGAHRRPRRAGVVGLAAQAGGDERFAWNSYRRLMQVFGKTISDVPG